jgi:ribonuclease D
MPRHLPARQSRRNQNHLEAQSTHTGKPQQIPDHPLICKDQGYLVEDNAALAKLVAHVREVGTFAYDTEFIGEASYYPQLCLIQIATPQQVALIDPLCDIDLTPIWQLIADPAVKTLVHAGQQDLEPVVRLLDLPPANIFDTQIAAAFASQPYPASLAHLVEVYCDVKLGKGLTYTAWDRRPLSPTHQRYACDDVRYLPAIEAALTGQLTEAGYMEALREEFVTAIEQISIYKPNLDALYNRIRSNRGFSRREGALLRLLVGWRQTAAQEQNLPPRSVVKDDVLIAIAKKSPKNRDSLCNLKHMPRPIISIYGDHLLELIEQSKAIPKEELPTETKFEESTAQRHRSEQLWIALNAMCHGKGIHPALVASRQETSRYCEALLTNSLPEDHSMNTGWRRKLITEPLQAMTNGQPLELIWADEQLKIG